MLHRIKGGAQLLSAPRFVQNCEALELPGPLPDRVNAFITLLEEQNQIIDYYAAKHTSP